MAAMQDVVDIAVMAAVIAATIIRRITSIVDFPPLAMITHLLQLPVCIVHLL